MSTPITAQLSRGSNNTAPFPLLDEVDAKLSTIAVDTIGDRDIIPTWKRASKMLCFVRSTDEYFRLGTDLTLAGQVWTEELFGVPADVVEEGDIFTDDGYIKPELIRNVFLNDSFVVDSEAEMLALSTVTGNFVIRTDTGGAFIKLNNDDPAALDDFSELSYPGAVLSVNGQIGVVTITAATLIDADLAGFNTRVGATTTISGVNSRIDDTEDDILDLQAAYSTKADLIAGVVPLGQLPYSDGDGITQAGAVFSWGGLIGTNITIDGQSAFDVIYSNLDDYSVTTIDDVTYAVGGDYLVSAPGGIVNITSANSVYTSTVSTTLSTSGATLVLDNTGMLVSLSGGDTLRYNADYSASYSSRSLVDKAYVDATIASSITSVVTASNGLHESGTDVQWGGTLSGDIDISQPSFGVLFHGTGGASSFQTTYTASSNTGDLFVSPFVSSLTNSDTNHSGFIEISSSGDIVIESHTISPSSTTGLHILDGSGIIFTGKAFFQTTATKAAINVSSIVGNPSSLSNGDFWTNSTTTYVRSTGLSLPFAIFSDTANGFVPFSGGGTTNFLRADGAWAAPAGGGGGSGTTETASNGLMKIGDDIQLGGPLTSAVDITGAFALSLGTSSNRLASNSIFTTSTLTLDTSAGLLVNVAGSSFSTKVVNNNSYSLVVSTASTTLSAAARVGQFGIGGGAYTVMSQNSTIMEIAHYDVSTAIVQLQFSSTLAKFTDSRGAKKGLEYAATGYVTQTHSLTDKEYVDALVASASTTASNGLTKVANDIQLGGTRTGNISITGLGDITFNDGEDYPNNFDLRAQSNLYSGTSNNYFTTNLSTGTVYTQSTGAGITYGGDFSASFTDRSLVDRGYVLGAKTFAAKQSFTTTTTTASLLIGSFAGNPSSLSNGDVWYNSTTGKFRGRQAGTSVDFITTYTASNGLTLTSTNFTLGGNITANTSLPVIGAFSLILGNGDPTLATRDGGYLLTDTTKVQIGFSDSGLEDFETISITSSGITILANITGSGIKYNSDYSGGYTSRSLTDKGYVDAVYTASNGLTKTTTNFTLGGVLTASTTVNLPNPATLPNGTITFRTGETVTGQRTSILLGNATSNGQGYIVLANGSLKTQFVLDNNNTSGLAPLGVGGNFLIDANSIGLQYGADYSATYTTRSLVDKGYTLGAKTFTGKQSFTTTTTDASFLVGSFAGDPSSLSNGDIWYNSTTGKFRGRQAATSENLIVTASNGLTKTSGNIVLGGALTQSTTLSGAFDFNFSYTGNSTFNNTNFTVNASLVEFSPGSYISISGGDFRWIGAGTETVLFGDGFSNPGEIDLNIDNVTLKMLNSISLFTVETRGATGAAAYLTGDSTVTGAGSQLAGVGVTQQTVDASIAFIGASRDDNGDSVYLYADLIGASGSGTGFFISDDRIAKKGLEYATDLSGSNFVNTSLIHKSFADTTYWKVTGTSTLTGNAIIAGDFNISITGNGNFGIGTSTFGTSAQRVLAIKNGTVPSTSPADSIQLYAQDVAASSELKVRDEAGNITTLSPHNFELIPWETEEGAWAFMGEYSKKDGTREKINADILKLIRVVEDLYEKAYGTKKELVFKKAI